MGRKKENKAKWALRLRPTIADEVFGFAKQAGKTASDFVEELFQQQGRLSFVLDKYKHVDGKKTYVFALPQECIEKIRGMAIKHNVTQESLLEAELRNYAQSPQVRMRQFVPVALDFIGDKVDEDRLREGFCQLCKAYHIVGGKRDVLVDHRKLVAQQVVINCIRQTTPSEQLRLETTLYKFCEEE